MLTVFSPLDGPALSNVLNGVTQVGGNSLQLGDTIILKAGNTYTGEFKLKNIAIILASLCGFAVLSEYLNMIVGIVFMVFCASFAGTSSYSVMRNLKISVGLVVVALAFQKL